MICGVGVDIAQIDRFESFQKYSRERLLEIFSQSELLECEKEYPKDSLAPINQFYASRFAAKEAFYKALSNSLVSLGITEQTFPFSFARKHVEVIKTTWQLPALNVNWKAFEEKVGTKLPKLKVHLSFSHEKIHAVALVVIEKENG